MTDGLPRPPPLNLIRALASDRARLALDNVALGATP